MKLQEQLNINKKIYFIKIIIYLILHFFDIYQSNIPLVQSSVHERLSGYLTRHFSKSDNATNI